MIEYIAIEVLTAVSFLYAFLLSLFYIGPASDLGFAFLWTNTIMLIYATISRRHKPLKLCALLLLAPIYYFNSFWGITFFILTTGLLIVHVEYNLYQNHLEYRFVVKNTYGILIALFGVWLYLSAFPDDVLSYNLTASFPFVIAYLMFSIILVRSERHIKSNMPLNTIRSSNFIFVVVGAFVFIGLIMTETRNKIYQTLTNTLSTLTEFMLRPLYALFNDYNLEGLTDVVEPVVLENADSLEQVLETLETTNHIVTETGFDWRNLIDFLLEKTLFILLIGLILWTMIRLSKVLFKNNHTENATQTVEKSFVFEKEKHAPRRNLFEKFFLKTPLAHIRYYYRKHLDLLEDQGAIIEPQDTSLEISKKAHLKGIVDADDIRRIYIEARYGDKAISKVQAEQMKSLCTKK